MCNITTHGENTQSKKVERSPKLYTQFVNPLHGQYDLYLKINKQNKQSKKVQHCHELYSYYYFKHYSYLFINLHSRSIPFKMQAYNLSSSFNTITSNQQTTRPPKSFFFVFYFFFLQQKEVSAYYMNRKDLYHHNHPSHANVKTYIRTQGKESVPCTRHKIYSNNTQAPNGQQKKGSTHLVILTI